MFFSIWNWIGLEFDWRVLLNCVVVACLFAHFSFRFVSCRRVANDVSEVKTKSKECERCVCVCAV